MFISCNRAEKQTKVLKKCYVEALLELKNSYG